MNVSAMWNGINMLEKVMKQYTIRKGNIQLMTLEMLQTTIWDFLEEKELTLYVEDSHARASRWLENVEDSMTLEELCSSRLQGSLNKSNHGFYSLKTLKGYYLTTKGTRSELSSIRWMNSGMTQNGKCLTLKTLESHKIGKGCSLSDIEEAVNQIVFSR